VAFLTKEELMEGSEIRTEPLTIRRRRDGKLEEVQVMVAGMNGYQRSIINAAFMVVKQGGRDFAINTEAMAQAEARTALACLRTEDGSKMFSNAELTGALIKEFGNKWEAGTIQAIFTKAQNLSGLSPDELAAMEGNSAATQNESSTSD
jgi:hypothetical protein